VEGADKFGLVLPGLQNETISRLAKANGRFVALMISGSPYTMPWIDETPAVVQLWYAGMEAGTAAARVLFGRVKAGGTMPVNIGS